MHRSKAEQILASIHTSVKPWQQPILIATFGLPGAGKTDISTVVGHQYPLAILSTDALRLTYGFPSGPATLEVMQQVAKHLLADNSSVVFDGIHMMKANRDELRAFGASCYALVRFIYVTANADTIAARLEERLKRPDEITKDGKFVITAAQFARIAQYLEVPLGETDVIHVDTSFDHISVEEQLEPLFAELETLL
jgi:predicted kinase